MPPVSATLLETTEGGMLARVSGKGRPRAQSQGLKW